MLSRSTNSSPGVWTELVAVYSPETGRSYIATVAELHFRGLLGTGRPAPRGEHSKGKLIVSRRKWTCWRHVRLIATILYACDATCSRGCWMW